MCTVSVKSVYTCTAQTVQSSRGQGSHHRTFLKDLEGSMENWIRKERMKEWKNERISTCRSRAYYVSAGQKPEIRAKNKKIKLKTKNRKPKN